MPQMYCTQRFSTTTVLHQTYDEPLRSTFSPLPSMSKFVFFPSLVNNILRCKSLSHPLKPNLLLAEHIDLLKRQLHPS